MLRKEALELSSKTTGCTYRGTQNQEVGAWMERLG